MKHKKTIVAAFACLVFISETALAQELIIYPQKGQSQEQMEKDKFECYSWSKQQSGFDPMAPPTASTPPPANQEPQSNTVKGAARGALVGVAVGAIAGDAGKGAAIGAASGGLLGGIKRRDQVAKQEQAEQQWAQDQANQYAAKRNNYNRGYSACMEGRGYTVK
ncbi:MAG: YMGG-like glycine zipper-containing protein [Deltaproteobacteria bacterium]